MKLNMFKYTFLFAAVTAMLASCDDDGYWEPFEADGNQYSFLTSEISRNYKRAASSEGKNPYFAYSIRRNTCEGVDTIYVNVTGAEKTLGYFNSVSAEGAEDGISLVTPDFVPYAVFQDGSYETQFILEYVNGYGKAFGSSKLSLVFDDDLTSPGGKNTASLSVACSARGTD